EAFMATTTSPGPGFGSGKSRTSSLRLPRKTTPRIGPPLRLPYHQLRSREGERDAAAGEARGSVDFPRDRERPLVVSDRVHAAGLDGCGGRRPPPLAQAALLRRAHRRPRLAHPDLRRAAPPPPSPPAPSPTSSPPPAHRP